MLITTETITPAAGTVWIAGGYAPSGKVGTLKHITFGVDHRPAQNLYEIIEGEGDSIPCEVEPWQVLSTVEEECFDCSGTGAVPSLGEESDNGQVSCTTCLCC